MRAGSGCGYRIVAVGGDDRADAPPAYVGALRALFAELGGPQWLAWWSGADIGVLELWYDLDVASARAQVRRREDVVVATVGRPLGTIPRGGAALAAARELAHRDVTRLVRAVSERMWLDDPPRLPSPAALGAALDAAFSAAAFRRLRLTRLVEAFADRLPGEAGELHAALTADDPGPETVDAVLDALYVRVLTGVLPMSAAESAELHAIAGGPPDA